MNKIIRGVQLLLDEQVILTRIEKDKAKKEQEMKEKANKPPTPIVVKRIITPDIPDVIPGSKYAYLA